VTPCSSEAISSASSCELLRRRINDSWFMNGVTLCSACLVSFLFFSYRPCQIDLKVLLAGSTSFAQCDLCAAPSAQSAASLSMRGTATSPPSRASYPEQAAMQAIDDHGMQAVLEAVPSEPLSLSPALSFHSFAAFSEKYGLQDRECISTLIYGLTAVGGNYP